MINPADVQEIIMDPKTIALVVSAVAAIVAFYYTYRMKQEVKNKVAADKITDSKVLAKGITLRYGTATGCREGKLAKFCDAEVRIDFPATDTLRKSSMYVSNEKFLADGYEIVHPDEKKAA